MGITVVEPAQALVMLFVPMAVMTDVLVVVTGTVITHVPEIVLPLVLMIVPVVLVVVLDVPELVRAVVLVTAIQAVILAVPVVILPVLDPALVLVILLALPLAPMTALADAKEPVQVDVVVLVITHAAFLVKLHVITIVLLFVLYLLCTVETRKKVY